MDSIAAIRTRLENLSPEQRVALLQKISLLRQQQGQQGDVPAEPILASAVSGEPVSYPLSQSQRRLWMLSQLGSDASAAYNIAAAFCFDRSLEPERLQRAWRRLLTSNEVLRSAFTQEDRELFQTPRAALDWDMQQQTLTEGQELEAQLLQLASTEAARPFDLERDWLVRVIHCQTPMQTGLVIVIHHIVCDGLSIASMIRELAQYYGEPLLGAKATAADGGGAEEVPPGTSLQYRDYVAYEAGMDTSRAKAYWKEIFADPPETLDALLDLPRPVVKDFSGSSVALTLAPADTAAFEALCRDHNATLYMGLVALVQLLLARFANVGEVTLGTPVAGRPGAQFDRVAGPFVNTIALRQRIDHDQSFPQLLVDVRRRVLGGFQHQGLAFDELITELGFAKDPSRSPLYDAMLGLTSAEEMTLSFGDGDGEITGRALRIPLAFSKVDLTFHFEKENDGSLRLDLEYASAVLLETSARRLCEAWHLLMRTLPQQSTLRLGEVALQTEEERLVLLDHLNATARPYPQHSSLVSEFRKTVQSCPDAIAVHAGDVRLSYRVLDELSDRVALSLLQYPTYQPGCRIALMLDKDERALIVILAILKSRCVYVPLAANTPLERVCQVLTAGAVRLLFLHPDRMEELQSLPVTLINADALPNADDAALPLSAEQVSPLHQAVDGDTVPEPAYLMFTSGSTGLPKGTLIEQRAVLRLVCNTDYHQVQANERVLLTGSLAFDAATFEIWGPLLNGGCVCIPAGIALLEVHEFGALVDRYQVDTAFLTTGLFNQLVDNSAAAFGRLQTVLTGGEKISVEHVRKLLQAQPALTLLHVYGPTENTTFSTWHRITAEDLNLATIPIGRPIANSRIYLLDQHQRPVPIGVTGEIYCGGDGIARGYIEQKRIEQQQIEQQQIEQQSNGASQPGVFLADPFLPAGAGRLYRTGDLAKWNHKRELVFVGRSDRQVKIRGFRVELGEVEHHLRTLPGVTDAFVQSRGDAGNNELVAWLVTPDGICTTSADVREMLKDSVPNYMLPAKVVCLQRLPLNASGKVDVRALPLPEEMAADNTAAGQLHGEAEQNLARLYATVLGLTGGAALAIDREANFFSLGGDSIRAIQLVSLARAEGYYFTLKDIFASETLAGLAASAVVAPIAAPEAALLCGPMSPTQQWWLDQIERPVDHFNLSSVFRIAGPVDLTALRAALDELLVLHPALRLQLDPDVRQQSIRESGRYVLREVETGQSRQQCWQQLQQAIDLRTGVLLAVGVAAETDATYLAVVVHHLVADEVSGRLFAENLQRLYHRCLGHSLPGRPERAGQGNATIDSASEPVREALGLINWSAQLQAAVERGDMDGDLSYWQDVVARGRQILDRQDLFSDQPAERGLAVQTLSPGETQALLQSGARLLRMTPQELLLAAFIGAWRRMLGRADCVLSLEGHGREQCDGLGDCSSTLGWFTSLYPCVFADTKAQNFDLYRSVKDSLRQVPRKGFTYLPLRYYKPQNVRDALSLRPLLSFNYLGETIADQDAWLNPANEQAGEDHGEAGPEPFKLDVLARISEGGFELMLRGQSPNPTLSLDSLADAWRAELGALAISLQNMTANYGDTCLLSLSDSLVPFASLSELDATLAALQLPATELEEILPLTGMQSGMWLHCATHPTAYQDQVALRLQQPLDKMRFASAVRALIAETQALRTGFAQTARGELLQIIFRDRTDNYQYLEAPLDPHPDGSGGGEDNENDLTRLRVMLRSRQRDLLRDPLFSLTLVRIHEACFELIIDFHHMALDGWTSALLLQRLEALYFGAASGGDSNAAGGMRPYFEWLGRQPVGHAREYWRRLLGDYQSRSDVPAHLPRIPALEPEPLFVETRIGAQLHSTLLIWCERQRLTVNAAVQALWGVFLGRLTGSDDLVYGATVSGRDSDLAGVANIAGMLINTLPVRIRPGDSVSFADLARETAQQFAESMTFAHLTLAEIQTLTPARAGLVTHALVFENYPASNAEPGAARWQWQPQEIFDPMHFEFGLIVAPLDSDLSFRFIADGNLYFQDRLEQMGAELRTLLAALLDAQQPFDRLIHAGAKGWSVSANFTADSLVGLLQYHEYVSGNSGAVTLLPYDQSVQELINPHSRLRRLHPQQHIVLWRPPLEEDDCSDVGGKAGHCPVNERTASAQLAELAAALATYARAATGSRVCFVPCPWPECHEKDGDWTLYRKFVAQMESALAPLHNAEVLSLEDLAGTYALQQPCYPLAQIFGDIPYTEEFFAAVANRLARQSDLHGRSPVKVYVVDADDTLWGGIVGEEGADGIRLEAVHLRLQEQLLNARAAGALICMATKNNEDDVRAVFEQREMRLGWSDLTRVCAGWRPKSESILLLAEELSLGLDSFVFIDDSPLECEQVLAACPGVLAVRLPPAEQRETFLAHLWLLDARAATREDAARAQMYAEEQLRSSARKTVGSYGEFLASLDIRVDMHRLGQGDLARVAQLSQRTNQFNNTGIRYSEAELDAMLQDPEIDIRRVSVSDKYGDYGLTGSVLVRRDAVASAGAWTVFGMMLSCRVLGRGVEHAILRQLAHEAAAGGVHALHVDFIKLARNAPALQFLQSVAAVPRSRSEEIPHDWTQEPIRQQFVLAVSDAAQWQPGVDGLAAAEDIGGGDASGRSGQQDSQPGARQQDLHKTGQRQSGAGENRVSGRMSRYYDYLAGTLYSGGAILRELQQQRVIQKTGVVPGGLDGKTLPATPTETALGGYFGELLGHTEIFREDSFADLGGHSLKAMMLFSRIVAHHGVLLDFRDLQAHPTLAALAARIDAATVEADASPKVEATLLAPVPEADSYPVSPGQSRLWMVENIRAAGPSPLHMHATLTVAGSMNREALDLALAGVFLRHEALRTCFRDHTPSGVSQVIVPVSSLDTRVHWFDEALDDAALDARSQEQNGLAFDLTRAPLLRVAAGELASGGTALFITMHHIISDGWSIGIFSRELTRLYSLHNDGDGGSLIPGNPLDLLQTRALQFRDFAQWQREWLASGAGARAVSFWRQHFADPVEALQLPAAAPRPALMQSEGASVHITIDAAVWMGFRNHLARLGLSDFSGLFAALQLVLARLSGQQNFCIGTAVAGRQHQQLESVIGFFVNILPLRTTLQLDTSVDDFLHAVAAEVNACLSHQGVPFDTIVSSLDLARDPGRTPLFDVLLVLQNTEVEDLRFGANVAQVHPVASTTSQYDLTLSAFPAADGTLKLIAEYDRVIYEAASIELILRCIACVLQGLTKTSHATSAGTNSHSETLASVPWLSVSDLARVEAFEGASCEGRPGDNEPFACELKLLPAIFRHAATTACGRISDTGTDWSYAELEQEMERIAALLGSAVSPPTTADPASANRQTHVGVIGNRSVRSVAAMVGAMAAGAVYIPLDLSNPVDRLLLVLGEGAVDVLLSTDEEGAELACLLQQRQPGLRHLRYTDEAGQACPGHSCINPEAVAYMIFTSGSTGKPKGVQISHAAFAAMIRQQIPAFGVRSDDVCGQFAALSFDASLSEVFLALATGASLAIAPHEARSDIDAFMNWLRDNAVTVLTLPPVFLRALNQRPLGKLRVLVTAGEAAIDADMRHYAASLRVLNAYGPTETSVCASTYLVSEQDAWPFGVPIGKPLPGVLLTVRDSTGARVPVGSTGELYIGGATLAEGYYAAPELSAQKFGVISGDPQRGRWYRTGDLARWREDGLLEFCGRADAQIKVRGYRIEPGEIEYAAREIEGVTDAVVLVHPHRGLLLYCLTPSAQQSDAPALRSMILAQLGRVLPRHMVPGDVLLLEAFPLSPAGKIARTALLELASADGSAYGHGDARNAPFVAPETEAERVLAQAWQRVLQAERVGRHDDFFALGGDSIKALEVVNALRTFGFSCDLRDFFASPSLREMADRLTHWRDSNLYREPLAGNIALLPVQNWFLRSRDNEAAQHFHIVTELKIPSRVTEGVLKAVLTALARNHDSLRARFCLHNDVWVQEIQDEIRIDSVLLRYRRASSMETQADHAAIAALACRPFTLETGPLFRIVLIQGPGGESEALVLALHHMIADWVSLRILIADLNALALELVNENNATVVSSTSPPHLLRVLAQEREAELASLPEAVSAALLGEYRKAVAAMGKLAPKCGVHSELNTLHLQIAAADLTRMRDSLRRESRAQHVEFRLQDLLLATMLSGLNGLLTVDAVPLLVESHGRDGKLDLARQVAWLTRARLFNVDPTTFRGEDALMQAWRILQADAALQPDVFACLAAESALHGALPALLSFNYLGEFASSQNPDDLFTLTGRVFDNAMAPTSPVDVPLHIECYVVDYALEIQIAWSPEVFDSEAMRACWEIVRRKFACF